jgi:hypothetical protein
MMTESSASRLQRDLRRIRLSNTFFISGFGASGGVPIRSIGRLFDVNATIIEFENLVEGLPLLGENDQRQGPKIEVPRCLAYYWRWRQNASEWRNYSFNKLKKVQIRRFVELCEQYGFREGRGSGMAPVDELDG